MTVITSEKLLREAQEAAIARGQTDEVWVAVAPDVRYSAQAMFTRERNPQSEAK